MTVHSSSSSVPPPKCEFDVLDDNTVGNLTDMGLSVFASLCGRNRGAFVLPNTTYSCLELPASFSDGLPVLLESANDIQHQFLGGNITASETMDVLRQLNTAVYQSTPNLMHDPYACNVNGLAGLKCKQNKYILYHKDEVIRAVTLAGLFVPTTWVTGGKELSSEELQNFYTLQDFEDMITAGLNTVVIPVPASWDEFDITLLEDLIGMARSVKLHVILQMHGLDGTGDAVVHAADFAYSHQVLALQIPPDHSLSEDSNAYIEAARTVAKDLSLLVPINQGQLQFLDIDDDKVFAALDVDHTTVIADIASSTSVDDRRKLFYHEMISCIQRSPIEYTNCFHNMPIFISGGFDLSIDNCVLRGTHQFLDFGQCDRFDETINSKWWYKHRQSFAARQRFAFEQGLGWTFATWKLYGEEDDDDSSIDKPEKLLSYKAVWKAGLLDNIYDNNICLNPPLPDFEMGDKTYAPTMAPVDCGNGWWNESIHDCSYWVPPPPTPAPTPCIEHEPEIKIIEKTTTSKTTLGGTFVIGAVIATVITYFFTKRQQQRSGYQQIPTATVT